VQLYKDKVVILDKLGISIYFLDRFKVSVNQLKKSEKQIPPKNYKDLKIFGNEHIQGAWTAPFDWSVIAIHSVLLPDETVMTFGSYAIEKKEEDKDIRENKNLILTDKYELKRDHGDNQWQYHNVLGGVDFDIWDPKKGIGEDSHTVIKKPLILDAFCSVVRVFDLENVFILGGNTEPKVTGPNSEKRTTFYNLKLKKFTRGNDLHFNRWYSSIVRTAEDKFVMLGGTDTKNDIKSIVPEILEKDNSGIYNWKVLDNAKSLDVFGEKDSDEWNYPKSYLASDGNIFGISYNKLWVIDPKENFKISKVGEIPLTKDFSERKTLVHRNPNNPNEDQIQILTTISAGVGSSASSVMIDKDKILLIGGKQKGEEYSPSNHVNLIDISDSKKPTIKRKKSMNYPRSNGDATILPTGEVFVNGGHSFLKDQEFSVLVAEIYNPEEDLWTEVSKGTFRRNYHSTSLLLTNGTILIAGGDVWNAEIYYPPYLFVKDWDGSVKFAKRPKIEKIDKIVSNRSNVKMVLDNADEVSKISLISTGSSTHAQTSELKYLSIDFQKISSKQILLNIPGDKNILQNGTYLIFAVNSSNVPSEGKIIYLK